MAQSISDEIPNGLCPKCGFHLQNTRGKQKICVNCDIHGDQPTDETNQYGDPGHAAVMQALGNVVPAKERVLTKQPSTIDTSTQKTAVSEKPKNVQTNVKPDNGTNAAYVYTVDGAIQLLREHFINVPVTDLKQAKALMKLRNEIEKLANKITNYNQGE